MQADWVHRTSDRQQKDLSSGYLIRFLGQMQPLAVAFFPAGLLVSSALFLFLVRNVPDLAA